MSIEGLRGTELKAPITQAISVAWKSPSNIALVKYWGKKGRQLPVNPSLSMSLGVAFTETRVTAKPRLHSGPLALEFIFEGLPNPAFGERISGFLLEMEQIFPFLKEVDLLIETSNTFPHSSGIASSASAFSALALCLCELEEEFSGTPVPDFYKLASYVARLGSGSAGRSVYGGFTLWGKTDALQGSDDEYAVPLNVHPKFQELRDAIILVNKGKKKVSSSGGHKRMESHPFAAARIQQAGQNIQNLLNALSSGDIDTFIKITENEALTLHALMMTSDPGFILMDPETVRIINRIVELRDEYAIPMCFTLDAGPNIHLLYFEKDREQVQQLIVEDLLKKDKQNWIDDAFGTGPERILFTHQD